MQASNDSDLAALKTRQTEIVKTLEKLRLRLNDMQKKLGSTAIASKQQSKATATATASTNTAKAAPARPIDVRLRKFSIFCCSWLKFLVFFSILQTKNLQELVIHVNPANIPYSLLGLQSLWTNRLNLVIECYTHSSVVTLPPQNREFVTRVGLRKPNESIPTLRITLIWKETNSTQLVGAAGTFIPICGEPNIVRYLIRIGPSEFGYNDETSIAANLEIDAVFDLVHELLSTTTKDRRSAILKRISQRLGTKASFGGHSTNVSDIAVLSVLKQLNLNGKELPANIKSWQDKNKTAIAV